MDIKLTWSICRQFRLLTRISFFGQFVYPVDGEGMGYLGLKGVPPATSFTLLEYMKICCNIQVIINPFIQPRFMILCCFCVINCTQIKIANYYYSTNCPIATFSSINIEYTSEILLLLFAKMTICVNDRTPIATGQKTCILYLCTITSNFSSNHFQQSSKIKRQPTRELILILK